MPKVTHRLLQPLTTPSPQLPFLSHATFNPFKKNLLHTIFNRYPESGHLSPPPLLTLWFKLTTSLKPAVPNLFGTRDQFHGRQFFRGLAGGWGGGDDSGGNVTDGGAADETSLACPLLTSCCVAHFLTGPGPGSWGPLS